MEIQEKEEINKNSSLKRNIILVSVIFVLMISAFIFVFCLYFRQRWYLGTVIAGVEVSGKTIEESKNEIKEKLQGYKLIIRGRNERELTIDHNDIDYQVFLGEEWDKSFSEQHKKSFVPFSTGEFYELPLKISYNKEKMKNILYNSELVKGSKDKEIVKPESAKLIYDKEKDYFVCKEEVEGEMIEKKLLLQFVDDALTNSKTEIDLTDNAQVSGVYKEPEIRATDINLQKKVKKYNETILRFINLKLTKNIVEKLGPQEISKLISYKDGNIKFKKEKIKVWTKKLYKKYDTVNKSRKIKSHTGKMVKVGPGDFGWQLNYEKTLEQINNSLKKNISKKYIDNYIKNPNKKNKKYLTISNKAEWISKGFKLNKNKTNKDWDEKNYIEVSLAKQKVYVFRKGKVKFSCNCISGLPVPGRQTKTGAFYLKEHLPEHTMVGADYRTYVHWWVRITWSGTGFHPASWQPWSRWSPSYYRYGGSHGCLNLAPVDAYKIYHMTKYGEAVFIH